MYFRNLIFAPALVSGFSKKQNIYDRTLTVDEWDMTLMNSTEVDGLKVTLSYSVSGAKDRDQFKVTVLDEDCELEESGIASVKNISVFESMDVTLELNADYVMDNQNSTFCIRNELMLDESSSLSVSFVETVISLSYDMTAGFFSLNSALSKKAAKQLEKEIQHLVKACICDDDFECIPKPVLKQDSKFMVCVFPKSDEIIVDSFESVQLYQNGELVWEAIDEDGEISSFVELSVGYPGVMKTRMLSVFFFDPNPAPVSIIGSITLGFFGRDIRRLEQRLRGGTDNQAADVEETKNFEIDILLKGDGTNMNKSRLNDGNTGLTSLHYFIMGGGTFLLLSFGATIIYVKC